MTGSPAATLREAASLLREYIGSASPGEWKHMCMGSEGCQVLNNGRLRDRKHVAWFRRKEWKADHADAAYVAAMGPQAGSPLADWLEAEAEAYEAYESGTLDRALLVARAILESAR